MIPWEYTYHQNMFCGALSVKPLSMDCSVHAPKELKKKKVRYLATSPLTPTVYLLLLDLLRNECSHILLKTHTYDKIYS